MEQGTVKMFSEKGFGFIRRDAVGPDVFFHHSVIEMDGHRALSAGDRVEFTAEMAPRGPQATLVRKVEPESPASVWQDD